MPDRPDYLLIPPKPPDLKAQFPRPNGNAAPIQAPLANIDALFETVRQLKMAVDSLIGQTGRSTNRAVTFDDLVTLGLVTQQAVTTAQPALGSLEAATKQYVDAQDRVHGTRISAVSAVLNNAVANGGIIRFDTVNLDTDGYAVTTTPFDRITIPAGLSGVYILSAWSSSSGTQVTTMGMGILVNGTQAFSETNQLITGPAAINYTLDNGAVEIGQLNAGDYIQLKNNSVSAGTNAFTDVTLSLFRMGTV